MLDRPRGVGRVARARFCSMSRLPLLLIVLAVCQGCDRRKGPSGEMKPADDWGGGDPSDPHAQVAPTHMDDPHAGVDMNDPHAGVDMGGGDPTALAPPDDRQIDPNKYLRGTITLTD